MEIVGDSLKKLKEKKNRGFLQKITDAMKENNVIMIMLSDSSLSPSNPPKFRSPAMIEIDSISVVPIHPEAPGD